MGLFHGYVWGCIQNNVEWEMNGVIIRYFNNTMIFFGTINHPSLVKLWFVDYWVYQSTPYAFFIGKIATK